jgi:SAM-dependent methyltransferase
MPVPEVVIVEEPRRFPRPVEVEMDRRHGEIRAAATGRVLDLADTASRFIVADAVAMGAEPAWDTVISVGQLIRFPDLALALQAIDRLLVPTGRLVAVEPVMRPGALRMFAAAPWLRARSVRGFHVGRDLPAALRSTTFVVDDLERFTLPTAIVPLRHFVAISVRRPIPITSTRESGSVTPHLMTEETR